MRFTPAARVLLREFLSTSEGNGGMTTIEFAILVPFMVILILGTIELGLDMWVDASVEAAAQKASRLGITTVVPQGKTRDQAVQDIIDSTLSTWTTLTPIEKTTVKSYASYAAVGQAEPYTDVAKVGHYVAGDPYTDVNKNGQWDSDQGTAGEGGYNDIVSYNITFTMHSFTGLPEMLKIAPLVFSRTFIVQNETVQTGSSQ